MDPVDRRTALALGALTILVLVAHGGSLASGYCWDDALAVLTNEHVRRFDLAGILGGGLWSGAGVQVSYWRPLTLLTIAAQLLVTQEPWFLHLGNVAIHLCVVLLVHAVALRATSSRAAAFTAAACFGTHPLVVEVVSGISNRGDALATAFVLLAVLSHSTSLRAARVLGTAAAVFAGCACKETGVAALPALLAWDLGLRAKGDLAALRRMLRGPLGLAWAAIAGAVVAYLLVRHALVGGVAIAPDPLRNPLSVAPWATQKVLALEALGYGFRLLAWPGRLSVDYSLGSLPTDIGAAAPLAALGVTVAVALAVVAARALRREPLVTVGLVLAAGAWLPVSNLLFPLEVMFAERFLYMPMAGLGLAVGGAVSWLVRSEREALTRRIVVAAGAAVLAALVTRTIFRTSDWKDQRTLVEAATRATPGNARVQVALAQLLAEEQRWAEADQAYARALEVWPQFAAAWTERAAVLHRLGRFEEAVSAASRALRLDPGDPICWYNLALELSQDGQLDAGLAVAREGTSRHPAFQPLAALRASLQERAGTEPKAALTPGSP